MAKTKLIRDSPRIRYYVRISVDKVTEYRLLQRLVVLDLGRGHETGITRKFRAKTMRAQIYRLVDVKWYEERGVHVEV